MLDKRWYSYDLKMLQNWVKKHNARFINSGVKMDIISYEEPRHDMRGEVFGYRTKYYIKQTPINGLGDPSAPHGPLNNPILEVLRRRAAEAAEEDQRYAEVVRVHEARQAARAAAAAENPTRGPTEDLARGPARGQTRGPTGGPAGDPTGDPTGEDSGDGDPMGGRRIRNTKQTKRRRSQTKRRRSQTKKTRRR